MINNFNMPASPTTKAIQFEAVPMWDTAKEAKKYVAADEKYKENAPLVKDILRNYARFVMNKADEIIDVSALELTIAEIEAVRDLSDQASKKKYAKLFDGLKKYVISAYKDIAGDYQLFSAGDMFSDKKSVLINDVYYELSEEEKTLLKSYKGLTSYFTGFFTNIETLVTGEGKGSIAYRITENLDIFFNNKKVLNENAAKSEEFTELLLRYPEIDWKNIFTQKGIDLFNEKIGELRQNINEINLRTGLKLKFPKKAYKMPLALSEKKYSIVKIENEEELYEAVTEALNIAEKIYEFSGKFLAWHPGDEIAEILIEKNSFAYVSNRIYGAWDALRKAASEYNDIHRTRFSLDKPMALSNLMLIMESYDEIPAMSVLDVLKDDIKSGLEKRSINSKIREYIEKKTLLANKKELVECFDAINAVIRAYKPLDLSTGEITCDIIEELYGMQDYFGSFRSLYNMARNYCTQSKKDTSTIPLTFSKSTFFNSLDSDKFEEGITASNILRRNGLFYLLVPNPSISSKLPQTIFSDDTEGYQMLEYKQLTGLNKSFPRLFVLSRTGMEKYNPSPEIIDIIKRKLYTKDAANRDACVKWIQFCIDCFKKNEDWSIYNVNFKKAEEYASANEFYTDVEKMTTRISFGRYISEIDMRKAVARGEVFLFKIYSRSFADTHKGKIDIQAKMLMEAFSDRNLKLINETKEPAIKICSGGNELRYRRASLPMKVTHPAGEVLHAKNPNTPNQTRTLSYDLYKDKRYMEDKFLISLCVQLGWRSNDVYLPDLNRMVNACILKKTPNVLSLRVGERDLLYYVVLSPDKKILEQGSLNVIKRKNKDGVIRETDYKKVIDKRVSEAEEAKKKWDYSTKIESVKEGYLSQAIHDIMLLIEKYNAVICVEDLSGDFMKSRNQFGTVYQQFYKSLINKLSCLPNDDLTNICQYCTKVDTYAELKGQNGIVFFVNPAYTSKCDPTTGFVETVYSSFVYSTKTEAKNAIGKLIEFTFDDKEKAYKITFDAKDLSDGVGSHVWTITSAGERYIYKDKKFVKIDCTADIKELFEQYKIGSFEDLKKDYPKNFYARLFDIIGTILKMNYYDPESDRDYMLSPVSVNGKQFDSRNVTGLPNTAAIKTYMMALKGMRELSLINPETKMIQRDEKGTMKQRWIEYLQTSVFMK